MPSWSLQVQLAAGPVGARHTRVSGVRGAGPGSIGVLTEAADMWVLPAPQASESPRRQTAPEVAVTRPKEPPSPSIAVTDPATVAKITRFINALETVQLAAISCPEIPTEGSFVVVRDVDLLP
jgi:hypothetical protein